MSLYYLMAQLPSLDTANESSPLPITWERFIELCTQHAGKKAAKELQTLTLTPERDGCFTGSSLLDVWKRQERSLRLALGVVRAARLGCSFDPGETISSELITAAGSAAAATNPLEAEISLNRERLKYLEDLRPTDPFSEDALYYYGIKLRLLERFRRFVKDAGRTEYRRIYDSVIYGAEQEVPK